MFAAALALLAATTTAVDVTSAESRKQTLLDYLKTRQDLSSAEQKTWSDAVKGTFGGKAVKDGSDEGVTVAKSVISGAIFFGVEPKRAAKAAYEAYHDTYRWVPPPLAINYQILVFQGRKPKESARQLAFAFPRYFNEDLAPELATWWDEMLRAGKVNPFERREIERLLADTRKLMRPMLRERLWRAVVLEAATGGEGASGAAAKSDLAELHKELDRDFRGVGPNAPGGGGWASHYDRYVALSKDLGLSAQGRPTAQRTAAPPRPVPTPKPQTPPPPSTATGPTTTASPTTATPPSKPSAPTGPSTATTPPSSKPPAEIFLDQESAAAEEKKGADPRRVPAPVPGEGLLAPPEDWQQRMVDVVNSWIGTPYLFGGTSRRGIDCSAFTRQVYRETFTVEIPRNGMAQAGVGLPITPDALAPGDLVFFDTLDRGRITHVGVFVGDGQIAHASSTYGVTRAKLEAKYYQRAYRLARTLISR